MLLRLRCLFGVFSWLGSMFSGSNVQGSVQGSGFRVQDSGFRARGSGFTEINPEQLRYGYL
jgi:hypothetical protein